MHESASECASAHGSHGLAFHTCRGRSVRPALPRASPSHAAHRPPPPPCSGLGETGTTAARLMLHRLRFKLRIQFISTTVRIKAGLTHACTCIQCSQPVTKKSRIAAAQLPSRGRGRAPAPPPAADAAARVRPQHAWVGRVCHNRMKALCTGMLNHLGPAIPHDNTRRWHPRCTHP